MKLNAPHGHTSYFVNTSENCLARVDESKRYLQSLSLNR